MTQGTPHTYPVLVISLLIFLLQVKLTIAERKSRLWKHHSGTIDLCAH